MMRERDEVKRMDIGNVHWNKNLIFVRYVIGGNRCPMGLRPIFHFRFQNSDDVDVAQEIDG